MTLPKVKHSAAYPITIILHAVSLEPEANFAGSLPRVLPKARRVLLWKVYARIDERLSDDHNATASFERKSVVAFESP